MRLDIDHRHLLPAAIDCLSLDDPSGLQQRVEQSWGAPALVTATLRTGFDALLEALDLPHGSEVIATGVSIPEMFEILEAHGLVVRGVDVDPKTLAPRPGALARARTPKTRLALVTHLCGSRIELAPLATELEGIPIVEDCAQAFAGRQWPGHHQALASLFSFGPLKTATALAGGIASIRDADLLNRMRRIVDRYPVRSRVARLRKVATMSALGTLCHPRVFGSLMAMGDVVGISPDAMIHRAVLVHGVVRARLGVPELRTLYRRIARYDPVELVPRRDSGERLAHALEGCVPVLGSKAHDRTWWLVPVVVDDPDGFVKQLRRHGFDATRGEGRLIARPSLPIAHDFSRVVYLPCYPHMGASEIARLAAVTRRAESASLSTREAAGAGPVSHATGS